MGAILIAAALAVFGQAVATTVASPAQSDADALVQQLREFNIGPGTVPSNGVASQLDVQRDLLYERLRQLADNAWPALSRGLSDPDVRVRRGVLIYLTFGVTFHAPGPPNADFLPCLPALVGALRDDDQYVRGWAAQNIGMLGANAAPAVPALLARLTDADDLLREDVAAALGQIGAPARDALAPLRNMLVDPNPRMRRVVQIAIDEVQGPQ
jgi:HEAT repeat protein